MNRSRYTLMLQHYFVICFIAYVENDNNDNTDIFFLKSRADSLSLCLAKSAQKTASFASCAGSFRVL